MPARPPNPNIVGYVLLLMLLALMLSGCAQNLPASAVKPPAVPPLPTEAQASQIMPPPICSQGCLNGWKNMVEEWLNTLTNYASPD